QRQNAHDANVPAPLHATNERVLEDTRTPRAMVTLYFMYENFGRVQQTLRVTPAMVAEIVDHVWLIEEIVRLVKSEFAMYMRCALIVLGTLVFAFGLTQLRRSRPNLTPLGALLVWAILFFGGAAIWATTAHIH